MNNIEGITEEHIDSMMEGYDNPEGRGPHFWEVLERVIIGIDYSRSPTIYFSDRFFSGLSHLIPCDDCAVHYSDYYQKNKPPVGDRLKMLQRLINLHDEVNERNGKPKLGFKEGLKNISLRMNINEE